MGPQLEQVCDRVERQCRVGFDVWPLDGGELPAKVTLALRSERIDADAVLAMYHDQGLPVLKHVGFHDAVNTTLGLPIIRTSVDHGTALDLAGSNKARPDSLFAAIDSAILQARNLQANASGA